MVSVVLRQKGVGGRFIDPSLRPSEWKSQGLFKWGHYISYPTSRQYNTGANITWPTVVVSVHSATAVKIPYHAYHDILSGLSLTLYLIRLLSIWQYLCSVPKWIQTDTKIVQSLSSNRPAGYGRGYITAGRERTP